MIDQGTWYRNATVDHAPSLSLPGHTTLATGTNPKTHGINSNAWLNPTAEPDSNGMYRSIIPHIDLEVETLGEKGATSFSPHRIKVKGIANWFRQSDANVRTVALSVTPLAVQYGGKFEAQSDENHVYWLGSSGRFVTSSYYRDNYPGWVNEFNDGIAEKYLRHHSWENSVPAEYQKLARRDRVDYEYDGVHTGFPHLADDMVETANEANYRRWFGRYSPYQNDALFDLARVAIDQLQLGQRGVADFLSIAVKLTDRVGHDFGPESLEQLDVIFRLDALLNEFFNYLDKTVGEGNYIVALSSDHGAPNVSEYELEQGREASRVSSEDFEAALKSVQVLVRNHPGDEQQLPELIAENLEQFPFIYKAMTWQDLQTGDDSNAIIHAYRNSAIADQVATYPLWTEANRYGNIVTDSHPANYGVIVELNRKSNIWAARSTHGSSYAYDRKVPILLMGAGVKAGISTEPVFTRDIAPTLARLSGVKYPAYVDGRMLADVNSN